MNKNAYNFLFFFILRNKNDENRSSFLSLLKLEYEMFNIKKEIREKKVLSLPFNLHLFPGKTYIYIYIYKVVNRFLFVHLFNDEYRR